MSDTATASAVADPIAAMSPDERQNWRLTGDLPSSPPSDADADPSPAEPAAQVESTDSSPSPASESGTPAKKHANLQTRHQQLDAEIASLNEKLSTRAKLRAQLSEPEPTPSERRPVDASPAASSPATAVPLDSLLKSPDLSNPPLDEGEFFAAYPGASLGQFTRYQTRYETLVVQRENATAHSVKSRVEAFVERRNAALKESPTLMADLDPRVIALTPIDVLPSGTVPSALNVVAQEIVESEHGIAMMRYLSDHPDVYDRLAQATSREAIAREMGRIEARVSQPVSPPKVAKTTTSAPAPSTSLGSRPTGAGDTASAAVVAGDFGRYRAEMNDRDRKGAS